MQYRKGSAIDLIYLGGMVFVIALIWILISYGSKIISSDTGADTTLTTYVGYAYQGGLGFNTVAPLFIIGMGMALVFSAFAIRAMPALFLLFFLMNLIALVISFSLSDAWISIFTSSGLQSIGLDFSMWLWVFQYYPAIMLILGIVFAIVVFIGGG